MYIEKSEQFHFRFKDPSASSRLLSIRSNSLPIRFQGPLATCQQKIQQRKQRPNIEHVADDVEAQLHHEAANLIETINKLEQALARNKSCHASLMKTRLELEAQIDVKANSIFIDEVKCMSIRQGMNMQAY